MNGARVLLPAAALRPLLLLQGLLRAVEAEAEALRIIHVRIQKQLQNLEVGASDQCISIHPVWCCWPADGQQRVSGWHLAHHQACIIPQCKTCTWQDRVLRRLAVLLPLLPHHHCFCVQTEEKLLKHMVNRTRSQRTEQELQQFDLQYPQEQAQRQQKAQQQRVEQQQARQMQKQQQELQGQSGDLSKQQQEEGQQQEGSQLQQLLLQHPLLGQHRQMLGGFRSSSEPAAEPPTQQQQQQQPAPEQQQQQQQPQQP